MPDIPRAMLIGVGLLAIRSPNESVEEVMPWPNSFYWWKSPNVMNEKHGAHGPSRAKATEMLEHGEVHGQPLTKKQKKLFRAVAHGFKPTRT